MIKGSFQKESITIINIYAPNIGAPKYINQILTNINRETDNDRITMGTSNTSLTSMDRLSRQKINKETLTLNDTLDSMDLIYIYIEHSIQK